VANEWDAVLRDSVNSTIASLAAFGDYLRSRGVPLRVVYVPLGIDVDPREVTAGRESLQMAEGQVFESVGLQTELQRELTARGFPFLDPGPTLHADKQTLCNTCENFFYFGHDGHWNARAHGLIAELLEADLRGAGIITGRLSES
jgi:hypothetical protein